MSPRHRVLESGRSRHTVPAAPLVRFRPALAVMARYAALGTAAMLVLIPVYSALVTSLTEFENLGARQIVPADWHWQNFVDVWTRIPLARYLLSSTIYSVAAAVCVICAATLAGYALSRISFVGKRPFVYLLLLTQVVPMIVLAMPLFFISLRVGLYDTYLGVIIVLAGISLAYPTFLMRSYFDSIPREIEEAAVVDGCSPWQVLWRVVLPLSGPGLLTSSVLVFFTTWQQFLLPMILTETRDRIPVTVGIFRLTGDHVTPWQLIMAASLIACVPPVVMYFIAQRFLEKGLTAGAVK